VRNLDYFTSERFIHDNLAARAETIVAQARAVWNRTQALEAYAVTWPRENVKADDGKIIEHSVICQLPPCNARAERISVLRAMCERTKAYGITLVERANGAVLVWFETQHGARVWQMPLERHGDVVVAGTPAVRDNTDALHILWRPTPLD
jgi:hypothetical protein